VVKKLLITGCKGQVGHSLVKLAQASGWRILAVDRRELDITNEAAVRQAVDAFKPDVIINAAAHTSVDKAEIEVEASYAINRDGPCHLAKAATSCGAALLHISTDYVFAGDKHGLYLETDPIDPQGVYGASKLAGEQAVAAACPRHIILRTAWVFGEHGNNFVKSMLRLGTQRDSLDVVADQLGGPTYAGDIAAALLTIAEQSLNGAELPWGVYHFAGEPHVSWFEFAQAIFTAAEKYGVLAKLPVVKPIATSDYPTQVKRPLNSRLDCTKIRTVFGIEPCNWRQALENIRAYANLEMR